MQENESIVVIWCGQKLKPRDSKQSPLECLKDSYFLIFSLVRQNMIFRDSILFLKMEK